LLGALAGCAVAFMHDTLAPQFEVELDDVTAVARCTADARGLLGIDDGAPDLGSLELSIAISSKSSTERVQAMVAAWEQRCPIYLALLKPNVVALSTNVAKRS
jgi:predicted LPLAT superfamily acyltransferase